MNFLERFDDVDRRILNDAANTLELPDGQYLIRRGEPGGDIYFLLEGSLEVIDTRSHPELILAVMDTGSVVGEIAFIDNAPRSADVRSSGPCKVLQWTREDLHGLLEEHDHLAATLYRNLSLLAVSRARSATHTAVAGARRSGDAPTAGLAAVQGRARQVAEAAKEPLLELEGLLRAEPDNPRYLERLRTTLDRLERDMDDLVRSAGEDSLVLEGARIVRRELQPYLTRSSLGTICLTSQKPSRLLDAMDWVHSVERMGDPGLGRQLDRWWRDRPTLRALRAMTTDLAALVGEHRQGGNVLLINGGRSTLGRQVLQAMTGRGGSLTLIDQSRSALARLEAELQPMSGDVTLTTHQQSFGQLAMGSSRQALEPQDLVLVEGMVEYMPDRLVVALLRTLAGHLASSGHLAVATLQASPDSPLLDHLLSWQTVRRSPALLESLCEAADLHMQARTPLPTPAMVFSARAPVR